MVYQIYPPELEQGQHYTYIVPKHLFLDLHLSIANGFVTSTIFDKRNDFDFDIVNFPFLMLTFLAVLLMVYTFRKILGSLEFTIMLRTLTREINV